MIRYIRSWLRSRAHRAKLLAELREISAIAMDETQQQSLARFPVLMQEIADEFNPDWRRHGQLHVSQIRELREFSAFLGNMTLYATDGGMFD